MLFQHTTQRQLPFGGSCGSPVKSKNSSLDLDLPRFNRLPTPLNGDIKLPYKFLAYDSNDIIAPAPKKPHCGDQNMYKPGPTRASSTWSLSTLDEDSDEDTFEADLKAKLPEWTAENDAYVELLQIVNNGSPKTFYTAPDSSVEFPTDRRPTFEAAQPMSIEKKQRRLDDCGDHTIGYGELLGRSPICRTQNPLPLDSMFSLKDISPEVTMRYPPNESTAMARGNTSEIKSNASLIRANPLALSFRKIHLRPRSLSVGARSGQAGGTF
ncbi:hypothetical protein K493DRAFT_295215 [Basidiobolus meristosporus CBS 931.73]|uniref:Uncharacterized protein n=1 Tax=Basidiobolus meristosporus CBS 931.73 TaxID=1314790 RepID=A0A1Y1ZCQ7_9FUNG|nr:hypothetical protein K493DRAFT_295215 [Basidiobolus meristosporus CBS 931.73]|eukprot:ORY07979.1 hypothetical protein K493DRAFT_295215 [Basidiobolus meristosporus CBS 931.73]